MLGKIGQLKRELRRRPRFVLRKEKRGRFALLLGMRSKEKKRWWKGDRREGETKIAEGGLRQNAKHKEGG